MRPTGLMALACAAVLTVACNGNGRNDASPTTDNGAVGTTGEKIDTSVGRSERSFVEDLTYAGNAEVEVDSGDWAIIKTRELDMTALTVDTAFAYNFAEPIFRLGNDYSKGIIVSTGYVGQKTANKLVTCLTDGHPGVSGGGVLNQHGELVGIPIGRMQGDYRFSFILPLRTEMFRRVTHLAD